MITIDPEVFAYDEENSYSHETFVVSGELDDRTTAAIVTALGKAAIRFMLVDETGVEHPNPQASDAALAEGLYTPNYVSDPEVTDKGVEVYVDCKGSIEDPMTEALRRILREELELTGADLRVSAVISTDLS